MMIDEPEVFLVDAVFAVPSTNGWHRRPDNNVDDNKSAPVDNWILLATLCK